MHNIDEWMIFLPINVTGLVIALLVPFLLNWKPSPPAVLLTVILNVPTLIFLGLVLGANENASGAQFVATLLVLLWGIAGVGVGLILWLILRITTKFDFHRFLDNQISRIRDWSHKSR
jgi:hypothetical protein